MDPADKFFSFLRRMTPVPAEECQLLREMLVVRKVPKGDLYLRAGDRTDRFAFVAQGLFRFYYAGEDGRDYTSWFAPENSFIPSYAMAAGKKASRFTVEALEDSTLAVFPFAVFAELEQSSQSARFITRTFLLYALNAQEEREASLICDDAETRYRNFTAQYPGLENRLKLHHIASYLGISPGSLSRIRKKSGHDGRGFTPGISPGTLDP